jgi:hypothetical protein
LSIGREEKIQEFGRFGLVEATVVEESSDGKPALAADYF